MGKLHCSAAPHRFGHTCLNATEKVAALRHIINTPQAMLQLVYDVVGPITRFCC